MGRKVNSSASDQVDKFEIAAQGSRRSAGRPQLLEKTMTVSVRY
jgi:hypothetical protein